MRLDRTLEPLFESLDHAEHGWLHCTVIQTDSPVLFRGCKLLANHSVALSERVLLRVLLVSPLLAKLGRGSMHTDPSKHVLVLSDFSPPSLVRAFDIGFAQRQTKECLGVHIDKFQAP